MPPSLPLAEVDNVPNVRDLGTRLVHCALALAFGLVSAVAIAVMLPQGGGREGSAFAPIFLVLGMGGALAVAWYALFDSLRRRGVC